MNNERRNERTIFSNPIDFFSPRTAQQRGLLALYITLAFDNTSHEGLQTIPCSKCAHNTFRIFFLTDPKAPLL